MDNNKILIWFVMGVVAFLALPVVVKQVRGGTTGAPASETSVVAASTGGAAVSQRTARQADKPEYNQPPVMNEASLTGSSWQVQLQGYDLKLSFAPGGAAYVTSPMVKILTGLDFVEGRWRVEGNTIYVDFTIRQIEVHEKIRISGSGLYYIYPDKDQVDTVKRF